VAAAGLVQVGDLLAVGFREIRPELVHVRIGLLDRRAVGARVQHRRRGHGELRRVLRHRLQELEVVEHRRLGAPDLARDFHERRLLLGILEFRVAVGVALVERHAVEVGDEVDVPPVAPELAVGHRLYADRFLLRDDLADMLVLDGFQLGRARLAGPGLVARVVQLLRAQQAADVVGAEWRCFALCHGKLRDGLTDLRRTNFRRSRACCQPHAWEESGTARDYNTALEGGRNEMIRSEKSILTTHAGALPRAPELRELVFARAEGKPYDRNALSAKLRTEVAEVVRRQAGCGIDSVNDGEVGKTNFTNYVRERLAGFEMRDYRPGVDPAPLNITARDARDFPQYF